MNNNAVILRDICNQFNELEVLNVSNEIKFTNIASISYVTSLSTLRSSGLYRYVVLQADTINPQANMVNFF
jgi:hypothetical protein